MRCLSGVCDERGTDQTRRAGHFRGERREAPAFMVAPFDIPRGCTATYFPETNVLVPVDSVAEVSNTPTSKYVVITVAPASDPGAGLAALRAAASASGG